MAMSIQNADVETGSKDLKTPLIPADQDEDKPQKGFLCLKGETAHNVMICAMFLIYWSLSAGFNVFNKKALNQARLPWMMTLVQLGGGAFFNALVWMTRLRPGPHITQEEFKRLIPIAMLHLGCFLCGTISIGAGAVSFTHIVKSGEPVFVAIFSGLLLGKFFSWQVYATLVPIISGVALASVSKNIGFTMLAFTSAIIANTFAALRSVTSKKILQGGFRPEQNMHAANLFGVLTSMGFVALLPLALIMEGSQIEDAMNNLTCSMSEFALIIFAAWACGYFSGEVAYLALDAVHPVTHAVGNTLKRIFIIVSAIIIFNTPMDTKGIIGSTIAILGAMVYSLAVKYVKTTYTLKIECIKH